MNQTHRRLSLTLLLVLGAGLSHAEEPRRRTAMERLEEGDAIRNPLLLRGGRFELEPVVGFTLGDAFRRTALYGIRANYHISEAWAIGLMGFGGLAWDTGLGERLVTTRPEKVKDGSFSDIKYMGTLELTYTPLVGKFALFGRKVFNYDIHGIVGVGANASGEGKTENTSLTPTAGLGVRTFITKGMSINVTFRDYIYSQALNTVTERDKEGKTVTNASEAEWSNHFALTVGLGVFFPQQPKIGK
ncbi:outer membrane beta-barrel domain-containing protein [Myxococcota bacterium]|nr:outer membrane beta-barrel domain-containing protein [Myxococcota bacterium]MBU1428965.1 outer membrane beta-barrel domain-containing protein [Myxococcota bacterium]MBU1899449.1 outer membrane beta-barrel domain-containing protein [Myxococcota bacterium]